MNESRTDTSLSVRTTEDSDESRAKLLAQISRSSLRPPPIRLGLMIAVVLVTMLVFSAWFCVHQLIRWQDVRDVASQRTRAAAIARRAVLDLSTVDSSTVSARLSDLLSISSGQFHSQVAANRTPETQAVKKSKVVSAGTINAVGVVDLNSRSASVAVAATAKVSDTRHKKPHDNLYRVTLHLTHRSGNWIVDTVDFVQ